MLSKKVIYSSGSDTIRLSDTNHCIAVRDGSGFRLEIDRGVNLDLACAIFKLWHQFHTSGVHFDKLVNALNAGLDDSKLFIGDSKIPLYYKNKLNALGILTYCNRNSLHGESIKYFHDLQSNKLRVWLDELSSPIDLELTEGF